MRKARWSGGPAGAVCALLLAAGLTACQQSPGSGTNRFGGEEGGPTADSTASSTLAPSGYGAVFLALDECSSRERSGFNEVSCTSERAAAQVIARHDGARKDGPLCPARTDFVLHISESAPPTGEEGDGGVPMGYACMRNLEAPHPGDPGGGGGPRTVVGDCVHDARKGEVLETACDGSGEEDPGYKVKSAARNRKACPDSTDLYVQLGGPKPVGCAERV